jgi:hypothetical protein
MPYAALNCVVLHYKVELPYADLQTLRCFGFKYAAAFFNIENSRGALHCTALHCTALHCVVLKFSLLN